MNRLQVIFGVFGAQKVPLNVLKQFWAYQRVLRNRPVKEEFQLFSDCFETERLLLTRLPLQYRRLQQ